MNLNMRIGKCSLKIWWIIFFIVQFFVLSTMISSLFIQEWVYSSQSKNYTLFDSENYALSTFNTSLFKGSLTECFDGCEKTNEYENLKLKWCIKSISDLNSRENQLICDLFTNLSKAGKNFIILTGMSVAGLIIWFIALVNYIKRGNRVIFTFFGGISGCIFYLAACISWFAITGSQADLCSESENKVPLCFSKGPKFIVMLAAVYPIISLLYFVVMCSALNRRANDKRVNIESNNANQGKTMVQESPTIPGVIMRPGNYTSLILHAPKVGDDFIPYGSGELFNKNDFGINPNDDNIEIEKIDNEVVNNQTQIISSYPPAVNFKDYEFIKDKEKVDLNNL